MRAAWAKPTTPGPAGSSALRTRCARPTPAGAVSEPFLRASSRDGSPTRSPPAATRLDPLLLALRAAPMGGRLHLGSASQASRHSCRRSRRPFARRLTMIIVLEIGPRSGYGEQRPLGTFPTESRRGSHVPTVPRHHFVPCRPFPAIRAALIVHEVPSQRAKPPQGRARLPGRSGVLAVVQGSPGSSTLYRLTLGERDC